MVTIGVPMATKEENPMDDIVTPETKGEYDIDTPEKSLFYLEMELRDKGEAELSEEEIERLIAAGILKKKKGKS